MLTVRTAAVRAWVLAQAAAEVEPVPRHGVRDEGALARARRTHQTAERRHRTFATENAAKRAVQYPQSVHRRRQARAAATASNYPSSSLREAPGVAARRSTAAVWRRRDRLPIRLSGPAAAGTQPAPQRTVRSRLVPRSSGRRKLPFDRFPFAASLPGPAQASLSSPASRLEDAASTAPWLSRVPHRPGGSSSRAG
jgi:hypothetical protein